MPPQKKDARRSLPKAGRRAKPYFHGHSTVCTSKNRLHKLHCRHTEKRSPRTPYRPYRKKRCPLKKGEDARTHAKHPYPVATRRSQHRKKRSPRAPYRPYRKKRCPLKKEKDTRHTRKTSLSRCHSTVSTPKKNDLHASYRPDLKKKMSAEKRKRCPHTRKTFLSRCHSTVSTPKKTISTPPPIHKMPRSKNPPPSEKIRPRRKCGRGATYHREPLLPLSTTTSWPSARGSCSSSCRRA